VIEDEVVREVRAVREALAAAYNYDRRTRGGAARDG
jgi:hypothetical protein